MYGTRAQTQWTVEEGRDRYLSENGFTLAGYSDRYVVVKVMGRPVRIKNRPSRQRVIPWHDIHHVVTGYGTDLIGEAEIGAWELRAGCTSFILYYLNGMAALMGLLLAPHRVLAAFRRARGQRTLYREARTYSDVLKMSVGELRAHLGVPADGAADRPSRLHPDAPVPQPA